MIDLSEVITDSRILANRFVLREGFVFTAITHPGNIYDAIVIKYPKDVTCVFSRIMGSLHSLEEHIDFINTYNVEKALIIADNIEFITRCPTLKYIRIIPADSAGEGFDYSPLYKMPEINGLQCSTIYGSRNEFSTYVDCTKISNLESVHITNSEYRNFNKVKTLKSLSLSNYENENLSEAFGSTIIDTLSLMQCKVKSLEGVEKLRKLQCLYLYYNRGLQDINALRISRKTLRALRIDNCPKIVDFSVLSELENLELLELSGTNELPSLSFLKDLKNLKTFVFSMNVKDGDLSPCMDLSYVCSVKNRKHYNLKDKDLPKKQYVRGNETIDLRRRLE